MNSALYVLNFYSPVFVDQLSAAARPRRSASATSHGSTSAGRWSGSRSATATAAREDLRRGDRRRRGQAGRRSSRHATSSTTTPSSAAVEETVNFLEQIYRRADRRGRHRHRDPLLADRRAPEHASSATARRRRATNAADGGRVQVPHDLAARSPARAGLGRDLRVRGWPRWWRGVEAESWNRAMSRRRAVRPLTLEVEASSYRLEFFVPTRRRSSAHLLEGDASGELAGIGRWRLFEQDGVDRGPLRVERAYDARLDEPARPGGPTDLRGEPRLRDAQRRPGPRQLLGAPLLAID